ncbi:MAG: PilW family protein [Methylococcales bacterium]|nr:PilW family protein [Methylococcales bacterium]
MKQLPINSAQRGITLIEIMIAMVIGLFLMGGVMQIFLSSQQTYKMQDNLSRMQENGRFAVEFISRDIRMAGYWGCLKTVTNIKSMLKNDATFDSFKESINGADNDSTNSNIIDGTDSLILKGVLSSNISLTSMLDSLNDPSVNIENNSNLQKGEIVLMSDCAMGDVFQITNSPSTELRHQTGGSLLPGNQHDKFQKIYGLDAYIYKFNSYTYFIKQNAANNGSALFRTANGGADQELVDGIENLQILYGADTDGDNTPNYYVPAGTVGLKMSNVISVRITLLVVSPDDNLTSKPIVYTYNGSDVTPTDNRLRKVFSATVAVRNRLP